MKIVIHGQGADVEVIHELLSPWNVSFSTSDEADVIIAYGKKPLANKKTIIIPSDSTDFLKWIKGLGFRVISKPGEPVSVVAGPQTVLAVMPQRLYQYDGLEKSTPEGTPPTAVELNENLILLTIDLITEYNRNVSETLQAKPVLLYRFLTGLPISYKIAPKRFRDFFMKAQKKQDSLNFSDKLPLDALRFILVRAIEKFSNKKLRRKTWNGKTYACIITHDVDTQKGLQMAKPLKKLEEKYGVPSTWYIPSKHYKLNPETIKELANFGEIGAHGTKHDGKLAQLSRERMVERLLEAKQTLREIIGCPIEGFRAPLLQNSFSIIHALTETGYKYDTSIPTWEPKHPTTMNPCGLGTVYPLKINGIIELPITLPQDHQMMRVLGMNARQTFEAWMELMRTIEDIGALCLTLTHPSYELASSENISGYEDLLNAVAGNTRACITLPKEAVNYVYS